MVKKKKSAAQKPATVLSRFAARFIDGFLFVLPFGLIPVIFFISTVNFLIVMDTPGSSAKDFTQTSFLAWIIVVLCLCAYTLLQVFFLATRGQSMGKMLMKIRIVDAHTGVTGGFLQNVFLREILNSFLSMIPFYFLVDCAFILQNDRRCIHDHIAGTIVVNV